MKKPSKEDSFTNMKIDEVISLEEISQHSSKNYKDSSLNLIGSNGSYPNKKSFDDFSYAKKKNMLDIKIDTSN